MPAWKIITIFLTSGSFIIIFAVFFFAHSSYTTISSSSVRSENLGLYERLSIHENEVSSAGPENLGLQGSLSIHDMVSSITNKNLKQYRIAIVEPTFTEAAYNNAFYVFYAKYGISHKGLAVTQDLSYLTSSLNLPPYPLVIDNRKNIAILYNQIEKSMSNVTVTTINDVDINQGRLFSNGSSNAFDVLIFLHEEYVTQKSYDDLKFFVENGGSIVFLDGNYLFAEVSYNSDKNTITLVKGHNWEYNGKIAKPSVVERWFNETKEWTGGNWLVSGIYDKDNFTNNIFNYTHWEENYVNSPEDNIILDYGAKIPIHYTQHKIATYELNHGNGKVIVLGLYAEQLLHNKKFLKFFDNTILQKAVN